MVRKTITCLYKMCMLSLFRSSFTACKLACFAYCRRFLLFRLLIIYLQLPISLYLSLFCSVCCLWLLTTLFLCASILLLLFNHLNRLLAVKLRTWEHPTRWASLKTWPGKLLWIDGKHWRKEVHKVLLGQQVLLADNTPELSLLSKPHRWWGLSRLLELHLQYSLGILTGLGHHWPRTRGGVQEAQHQSQGQIVPGIPS